MKHRIATVKATGERFLVVTLDFRSKEVVCYGQVTAFTAGRALGNIRSVTTLPGRSYSFLECDLTPEVEFTHQLAKDLLAQAAKGTQP